MEYEVVELGPMLIMGVELRTTNENWQSAQDIPALWDRFYTGNIKEKIPNKKSKEIVGLYCEYEKDHTKPYTLVAGCCVTVADTIPSGLALKSVPAAKYAVFEIEGKFPDALMETWKWVWMDKLRRAYTGDLEIYPEGWNLDNPNMKLYISIK